MGASVFSRPQTPHDSIRFSSRITDSGSTQADGDRHQKPSWNSLMTRKRLLVQIRFGPRHFSKTCLGAQWAKGSQPPAVLLLYRWPERLTLQCE
jgi:hypothetical protein